MYLHEPVNKLSDVLSELSFSSLVVEGASLVQLQLLVVPPDDELLFEDFLVVH